MTERVRRNTQVVSDAAYKGVNPHIVEMDRRPGIIVGKFLLCASLILKKKLCGPALLVFLLVIRTILLYC